MKKLLKLFDITALPRTIVCHWDLLCQMTRRNIEQRYKGSVLGLVWSFVQPLIPEGVIQELVVNMFLHRDYFVSSPWRVMIFDDRIELISPGCLPNRLDIEKIKAGVSVARNPLIFSFATKEMPYRGLGTGIRRALELGAKIDFGSDREQNLFKAILWKPPF